MTERHLEWTSDAWAQYQHWKRTNQKLHGRIRALIADALEHPFTGIGKPEPLKGRLSGYWSRRIDREHRLVYSIDDGAIYIISCRYHHDR